MSTPWERLEGRVPVNKAAASIVRNHPDQESPVEDFEHLLLLERQKTAFLNAQYEDLLDEFFKVSEAYCGLLRDSLEPMLKAGLIKR